MQVVQNSVISAKNIAQYTVLGLCQDEKKTKQDSNCIWFKIFTCMIVVYTEYCVFKELWQETQKLKNKTHWNFILFYLRQGLCVFLAAWELFM